MEMSVLALISYLFVPISFLGQVTVAEPVQFCKHGANSIDFCMGVTMHENTTTNSYDLYMSFVHTRYDGSDRGWTAIGTGNEMAGSLMFIVYGDPLSKEDPIVSIRSATGHVQPRLITKEASGGLDMRVLRSQWIPTSSSLTPGQPAYEARVSIVCYTCHLWPGSKIDATNTAQPWIWAWNENQEFDVFSFDAHLKMHQHHASSGGWGKFYVDMARSINRAKYAPSLPPIRVGVKALGASESPGGTTKLDLAIGFLNNPAWHLHGFFMAAAFLVLFPAGIIGVRSGSSKAFKYHWILQFMGNILTAFGVVTGLFLTKKITTYHQVQGFAIFGALNLQGLLGWRHHIAFLQISRRTWVSHLHVWLGRLVIIAGWINLLTGLLLRGYPKYCLVIMAVLIGLESVGLSIFIWLKITHELRAKRQEPFNMRRKPRNGLAEYFAVEDDESDAEDLPEMSRGEEEKILRDSE